MITKPEFMSKFDLTAKQYTKAYRAAVSEGFWLAPDNSKWVIEGGAATTYTWQQQLPEVDLQQYCYLNTGNPEYNDIPIWTYTLDELPKTTDEGLQKHYKIPAKELKAIYKEAKEFKIHYHAPDGSVWFGMRPSGEKEPVFTQLPSGFPTIRSFVDALVKHTGKLNGNLE